MIRSFVVCALNLAVFAGCALPACAQPGAARPALIPQAREFTSRPFISLAHGVRIVVPGRNADDLFAAQNLASELKQRGVAVRKSAGAARFYLLRDTSALARRVMRREKMQFDPAMQAEGYLLITEGRSAYVIGHTATGVFYGAQTLAQLEQPGGRGPILTGAAIRDWPAMRWRGVHDDLSRGPVPTLAFQEQQIRTFAAYKLNVYVSSCIRAFLPTVYLPKAVASATQTINSLPSAVAELVRSVQVTLCFSRVSQFLLIGV